MRRARPLAGKAFRRHDEAMEMRRATHFHRVSAVPGRAALLLEGGKAFLARPPRRAASRIHGPAATSPRADSFSPLAPRNESLVIAMALGADEHGLVDDLGEPRIGLVGRRPPHAPGRFAAPRRRRSVRRSARSGASGAAPWRGPCACEIGVGATPTRTSVRPKIAAGVAIATSTQHTTPQPPPKHAPCTRAKVGRGNSFSFCIAVVVAIEACIGAVPARRSPPWPASRGPRRPGNACRRRGSPARGPDRRRAACRGRRSARRAGPRYRHCPWPGRFSVAVAMPRSSIDSRTGSAMAVLPILKAGRILAAGARRRQAAVDAWPQRAEASPVIRRARRHGQQPPHAFRSPPRRLGRALPGRRRPAWRCWKPAATPSMPAARRAWRSASCCRTSSTSPASRRS